MRLNPSKTLPPSFHQGLRLTSEHDNPWKLPVCEWRLVRHLKLAIHKCYTILKIASSPLHDELLTDRNSWYPSFISGILKCFIWLRHPVSVSFIWVVTSAERIKLHLSMLWTPGMEFQTWHCCLALQKSWKSLFSVIADTAIPNPKRNLYKLSVISAIWLVVLWLTAWSLFLFLHSSSAFSSPFSTSRNA